MSEFSPGTQVLIDGGGPLPISEPALDMEIKEDKEAVKKRKLDTSTEQLLPLLINNDTAIEEERTAMPVVKNSCAVSSGNQAIVVSPESTLLVDDGTEFTDVHHSVGNRIMTINK